MEALEEARAFVAARSSVEPNLALVLGTGLGALAREIDVEESIPYGTIPHFPLSTVESHDGALLLGSLGGQPVVAMQGRFHLYEGYDLKTVTFPIRVMALLGARTLIVSGACGGMNPEWNPGELVLLTDHINLLGENPLVGPNLDDLGPRFPDMSEPYTEGLQELALDVAHTENLLLRRGVYVAVQGPNLETRAEYRMLRGMGADVVGMSTVPEVIVARHMGMEVLGVTIITDACLPEELEPVDVATIIETAKKAEPSLTTLIRGVAARLPKP
jgi:purine-nucleoside phosphorylase